MPAHVPGRPHRWTVAQVERLAESAENRGDRYELVDGELLVTPAPSDRHQRIVAELNALLRDYVRRNGLGEVRLGPATARIVEESLLEPDLFVVAGVNGQRPRMQEPITPLLLVVEVLSPGSVRNDRGRKRRFYQSNGVPEYWLVDGDAATVEVWRAADDRPAICDGRLEWAPRRDVQPFMMDLEAFFADVADPSV